MSASMFAWLVPLSLVTFSIAFLVLRLNRLGSWWWPAVFGFGAAAFASSLVAPAPGNIVKPLLDDLLFLAAFVSFAGGVSKRSARPLHRSVVLPLAFLSLAASAVSLQVFQSVRLELLAVQTGIALILLETARQMRGRTRHLPDQLLVALVLAAAAFLVLQNLAIIGFADPGLTTVSWNGSVWALVLQASGATIGVLMAVVIFVVVGRDMIDDLRHAAESDPLTGTLNRRGFDQRCAALIAARRRADALSLILIDLDHFKAVNDRFGHWAGDSVLCAMTALLTELGGPKAVIGRLGGEEFAMLLPAGTLAEARATAESIRAAFSTTRWPAPIGDRKITASFGVTDFADGETMVTAAERADRLLYIAKHHGRNQVCFCSAGSTILPPDSSRMGSEAGTITRLGKRPRAA